MLLFGIYVYCLSLFYANLALESSHDYYDYDQDQGDAMVSTKDHFQVLNVEKLV